MNEIKTYRDLVQAILDGYLIEYKSEYEEAWIPIHNFCFDTNYLDDELQSEYRISTATKPSIDWSQVDDEYLYLAKNRNGKGYLYKSKPDLGDNLWLEDNAPANANSHKSYTPGNCYWRYSLIERPREY